MKGELLDRLMKIRSETDELICELVEGSCECAVKCECEKLTQGGKPSILTDELVKRKIRDRPEVTKKTLDKVKKIYPSIVVDNQRLGPKSKLPKNSGLAKIKGSKKEYASDAIITGSAEEDEKPKKKRAPRKATPKQLEAMDKYRKFLSKLSKTPLLKEFRGKKREAIKILYALHKQYPEVYKEFIADSKDTFCLDLKQLKESIDIYLSD